MNALTSVTGIGAITCKASVQQINRIKNSYNRLTIAASGILHYIAVNQASATITIHPKPVAHLLLTNPSIGLGTLHVGLRATMQAGDEMTSNSSVGPITATGTLALIINATTTTTTTSAPRLRMQAVGIAGQHYTAQVMESSALRAVTQAGFAGNPPPLRVSQLPIEVLTRGGVLRVSQTTIEVLTRAKLVPFARVSQIVAQVLASGDPRAQVSQVVQQILIKGDGNAASTDQTVRISQIVAETLIGMGDPQVRMSQIVMETLVSLSPSPNVIFTG